MIPHIVAGRIAIARIVATMVVWTLMADSFAHQVINLWNILIPSFRGFVNTGFLVTTCLLRLLNISRFAFGATFDLRCLATQLESVAWRFLPIPSFIGSGSDE